MQSQNPKALEGHSQSLVSAGQACSLVSDADFSGISSLLQTAGTMLRDATKRAKNNFKSRVSGPDLKVIS